MLVKRVAADSVPGVVSVMTSEALAHDVRADKPAVSMSRLDDHCIGLAVLSTNPPIEVERHVTIINARWKDVFAAILKLETVRAISLSMEDEFQGCYSGVDVTEGHTRMMYSATT